MNPPSDGDDVAAVTPLRRREAHLVAVPTVRDPLPAETSVWDTGEPGEPPLRRSRQRRIRGALTIGWRIFRSRPAMARSRPAAIATIMLACAAAATAVALNAGSRAVTGPRRPALSSLVPGTSSSAKLSARAAHPASRQTRHIAHHRVQHTIQRRRTSVTRLRAPREHSSSHPSSTAQTAPPTPTTTATPAPSTPSSATTTATPAPSTPVSNSGGASSTVAPSGSTSGSSRPAGPSGSGAAFGPGY